MSGAPEEWKGHWCGWLRVSGGGEAKGKEGKSECVGLCRPL